LLRKTKGSIAFTSSGAAIGAYASWGAYGSSKAAMNSLASHIAAEEKDITSIAIGPGRCDTAMQEELRSAGKGVMAEHQHNDFVQAFEEGRLNKPEWPAHVMAKFVVDPASGLSGKYLR